MATARLKEVPTTTQEKIDWADIKFALFLGIVIIMVKLAKASFPDWQISRITTDDVASVLTVGYILFRARKQPEKLEAWGLTTRITPAALLSGFVLCILAVSLLAAIGASISGSLDFEPGYVSQMVEYIPAAFPQQFVMCSVGLAFLARLKPFHGAWRLPLVVGLVFSLAHFWTPARIIDTIIPLQMVLTFPAGFLAAFYFLKFRTILPLTAIHAIAYPLLHNWIEVHLQAAAPAGF